MANFLKMLFGSSNEAEIKRLRKIVAKVDAFEPEMKKLTDEELQAKTPYFLTIFDYFVTYLKTYAILKVFIRFFKVITVLSQLN